MGANDAMRRYGEKVAAAHLVEAGWTLLDRNWRGTRGELDVVALDGDVLVAVEVKTRRGTGFGHPAQAVTPAKLVRLAGSRGSGSRRTTSAPGRSGSTSSRSSWRAPVRHGSSTSSG